MYNTKTGPQKQISCSAKSHPNSTLQPHPTNKIVIDSYRTCADRYNHATNPETCKLHATPHRCHYSKEVTLSSYLFYYFTLCTICSYC